MVSLETKNRFGYGFLTAGVVLGLLAAYHNDSNIREVNEKQTSFIIDQCERDGMRNKIVIDALEGAQRRAAATFKDNPVLQAVEVDKIQRQIDGFKNSPPCKLP